MTYNDQFEDFLREFEPRRPRALPAPRAYWTNRLAAAAIVIFALTTSTWFSFSQTNHSKSEIAIQGHKKIPPQRIQTKKYSSVLLTRQAAEDPDHLDALLDAIPNNRLPRFDQKNSALHILAKE